MDARGAVGLFALLALAVACASGPRDVEDAPAEPDPPIHTRIDLPSIAACGGCRALFRIGSCTDDGAVLWSLSLIQGRVAAHRGRAWEEYAVECGFCRGGVQWSHHASELKNNNAAV